MLRSVGIVCVVVASILAPLVVAQDANWFKKNDRGSRYEGVVDRPHALKNYELLGFFANRQGFSIEDSTRLRLRFFLPDNEAAYVSAQEIRVEKQYLMKPKPISLTLKPHGWSEFSDWPVAAVIKPSGIRPENIGVVVRLRSESEANEEIAPVVLQPATDPAPATINDYTLYLTADAKLRSVEYQVTAGTYNRTFQYKEGEKNRSVEARSILQITIPAAMLPVGPATIHIRGEYANSLTDRLSARFRFYHSPGGR